MSDVEPFVPEHGFPHELRWFARLRFLVIGLLLAGTVGDALWTRWTLTHTQFVGLAGAIFAFNIVVWLSLRRTASHAVIAASGWIQLSVDVVALTLLSMWTGGVESPLIWLFLVVVVFARLLLPPTRIAPHFGAIASILLVFGGLWITDQWPSNDRQVRLIAAWLVAMGVISIVAHHIMRLLKQRDIRLDQQHALTEAIVDTAVDGVITIDRHGTMLRVNRAAEAMFGYGRGELIGQNVRVLMPEPYHEEHDGYIKAYLETGIPRIIGIGREVTGRRHDGTVFPIELAVSETKSGGLHLFTGVVRDVTERNAAHQRLKELNEKLVQQRVAMIQHEKMVAVGQLAAGIIHEIANPLACMDSVLQLAMRNADRVTPDMIPTLRTQIERIRKTMADMSAYVHPDETPFETVSVNDMIEGAINMVRFDHRIRAVNVERELAEDVGEARLMPHAVQQVLVNLILNALDAVADAADPRITIRSSRAPNDEVRIEVEDNGTGISPGILDRVFDPFFTTKPPGKGTGLGLSICQRLMGRMGGRIELFSREAEGTRFTLHLPGIGSGSGGREQLSSRIPNPEKDAQKPADSDP